VLRLDFFLLLCLYVIMPLCLIWAIVNKIITFWGILMQQIIFLPVFIPDLSFKKQIK